MKSFLPKPAAAQLQLIIIFKALLNIKDSAETLSVLSFNLCQTQTALEITERGRNVPQNIDIGD